MEIGNPLEGKIRKINPWKNAKETEKVPRRMLSLEEKISVIKHSQDHKNATIRTIAKDFKVGRTQISSILKKKSTYLLEWESNESKWKKAFHKSQYQKINDEIFRWYVLNMHANVHIDGPTIKEEALNVAKRLGFTDFKASEGWLSRFKHRNNLKFSGRQSSNKTAPNLWNERLKKMIQNYSLENIYNMDETVLLWEVVPGENTDRNEDRAAKTKITLAFLVNALGEKEQPIILVHSEYKDCLDLNSVSEGFITYGCQYYVNDRVLMDTGIIIQILKKLNEDLVTKSRHIILFLDNAPCHPQNLYGQFSNIKLIVQPKNTMSWLQPLNAGIVQNFKVKYRRFFLSHVISNVTTYRTFGDVLESLDILQAIRWIVNAWCEVSVGTISNCFKSCGLIEESIVKLEFDGTLFYEQPTSDDALYVKELMHQIWPEEDVDTYLLVDKDILAHEPVLDIDSSDPSFKEKIRNLASQPIEELHVDPSPCPEQKENPDKIKQKSQKRVIRSASQALKYVNRLMDYVVTENFQEDTIMCLSTVLDEVQEHASKEGNV